MSPSKPKLSALEFVRELEKKSRLNEVLSALEAIKLNGVDAVTYLQTRIEELDDMS